VANVVLVCGINHNAWVCQLSFSAWSTSTPAWLVGSATSKGAQ